MKLLRDEAGTFRIVREIDNDAEIGIPLLEFPDLAAVLDWPAIVADLQAELFRRGLTTATRIATEHAAFTGAILAALRPRIIQAYKDRKKEQQYEQQHDAG